MTAANNAGAGAGSGEGSGSSGDATGGWPGMGGAPFADIRKMLEQFKLPGVDVQALMEGRRRDIDAVTAANRKAFEGMKALAERQAEMIRESVDEWQAAVRSMSGLTPAEQAGKTAELGKQALDRALANMRELAETSVKSQTEAWKLVNDHFRQSLEDMKKAFRQG